VIAIVVAAEPVRAERPGFEMLLDNVVDRPMVDRIAAQLSLSEEQYAHFLRAWESYFDAVTRLDQRENAHALEVLTWWHAKRQAGEPMTQNEIDAPAIVISRATLDGDALLDSLLSSLGEVLAEDQREKLPIVRRRIRYENWRGISEPLDSNTVDFGRRFNLIAFADEEIDREGTLRGLLDVEGFTQEYAAAMDAYEQSLDLAFRMSGDLRRRRNVIVGGERENLTIRLSNIRFQAESQVFEFLTQKARAHLGESAARQFEITYWRELAPRCFMPFWLESNGADWLAAQTDIASPVRTECERVLTEFASRIHEYRASIFTTGISARKRHSTIWGSDPLQCAVARAMVAAEQYHVDMVNRLGVLLPEGPSRDGFESLRRSGSMNLGTHVPGFAYDAIKPIAPP